MNTAKMVDPEIKRYGLGVVRPALDIHLDFSGAARRERDARRCGGNFDIVRF